MRPKKAGRVEGGNIDIQSTVQCRYRVRYVKKTGTGRGGGWILF